MVDRGECVKIQNFGRRNIVSIYFRRFDQIDVDNYEISFGGSTMSLLQNNLNNKFNNNTYFKR